MKTLYLMRHAKSSWSFDDLSDRERPLNGRGRTDAPAMGEALEKRNVQLDLLVSSPAVRALSTAALVASVLKYPHDQIQVVEKIYQADVNDLMRVVHELPNEANSVLLVGHNNTITDFANLLSPSQIPEMTTAAILCLRFDTNHWAHVDRTNAEYYFYDHPRHKE
ncbi:MULTISPECIES: SixA phosphatase family protein [Hymenobacter]|uniref:SixA phosphatase family protein n=1 Tax=Hymenobacter TaxID=89966 RepID=UPI001058E1EC|nr:MULTISPECIES: histidine phosphatase family protein [Hymenobacter]QIL76126.1 histidine phosphatase family protein [Hymenobacter sp. HDW8]